jgi:hypothetical protein
MEPSAKYALGAGVGAPGREVDASTAMSSLSTYLVDYGHLTPCSARCQSPSRGVVW